MEPEQVEQMIFFSGVSLPEIQKNVNDWLATSRTRKVGDGLVKITDESEKFTVTSRHVNVTGNSFLVTIFYTKNRW